MIYRSNLTCPDLTPHFKHLVSRPMPHSFGHDVPSDWGDKADDDPVFGLYKKCGFWTHDEAAILFNVASVGRFWCDIGTHTGWTAMHVLDAGNIVTCVDPMFRLQAFQDRFEENTEFWWAAVDDILPYTSRVFFELHDHPDAFMWDGFCIDGDHEPGEPLLDAQGAARHLTETGVIIFHDFIGKPVREAVEWLRTQGFKDRVYFTPHMVCCCWRGDFVPPDHTPDPNLPDLKERCPDFDFGRCV